MSRRKSRLSRDPDGGWGWVVVATSLVACTVQVGATISFSAVIYTDLIEAYDVSTWLAGMATMAASVGVNSAGKTLTPLSTPLLSNMHACAGLLQTIAVIAWLGLPKEDAQVRSWLLFTLPLPLLSVVFLLLFCPCGLSPLPPA